MFGPFGGPKEGPFGGPGFFDLFYGPFLPLIFLLVVAYLIFRVARGGASGSGGAAFLEAISVLAVGVLISLFVGFGIQAFYPAPAFPEPPGGPFGPFGPEGPPPGAIAEGGPKGPPPEATEAESGEESGEQPPEPAEAQGQPKGPPPGAFGPYGPGPGPSAEEIETQREFGQEVQAYQEDFSEYARVASPITVVLAAALILAAATLLGLLRVPAIRDGVALGGVLTLLYGLGLAFQAEGSVFRFLMITVALVTVLAAVYLRFRPGRQEATPAG